MADQGSTTRLKGSNIVLTPEMPIANVYSDFVPLNTGNIPHVEAFSTPTPTSYNTKYQSHAPPENKKSIDDPVEFATKMLKAVHDHQTVQKQQQESVETLRKALAGCTYVNSMHAGRILKILHDMQVAHKQQQESMEVFQKDITDSLQEQTSAAKLLDRIKELTGLLEEKNRGPSELSTVLAQVQSVESRMNGQMKQMMEEIHQVRTHQQQAETGHLVQIHEKIINVGLVPEVRDVVCRSEMQLGDVLKLAQSVSADSTRTSRDVQELQGHHARIIQDVGMLLSESKHHYEEFAPCLEAHLTEYLQETPVNVDFQPVLDSVSSTRSRIHVGFEQVLNEIARVQQALNVDFARVMDDVTDSMRKSLADIGGRHDERGASPTPSMMEAPRTKSIKAYMMNRLQKEEARARKGGTGNQGNKRFRHYWAQTESAQTEEVWVQTDDAMWKTALTPVKTKKKNKKVLPDFSKTKSQKRGGPAAKRTAFSDAEAIKNKMRNQLMQPQYNVTDYYWDTGWSQFIATHPLFENFTLLVTLVNVIWIGVDADHNDATLLIDAHPVFQVAENMFCTFFTFELLVRFLAFREKQRCLRDRWFVFDTLLVLVMIGETWVLSIIMLSMENRSSGDIAGLSILRIFRFAKVVRVSRLAKLLRAIPEIVILLKGISIALRSVVVFFILWMVIIFVFGIIFRQMTNDEEIGERYFSSVPVAMNTLLLNGLLPENAPIVNEVTGSNPFYWMLMMAFIVLASLTLMHMLMGVLVETIGIISVVEKEGLTVTYVSSQLRYILQMLDYDPDSTLTKTQFQKFIMEPAVARLFRDEGVDTNVLIDMAEIIYQDLETTGGGGLTFEMLVEIVLNMRGSNPATVKDVKETLRLMKSIMRESLNVMHSSLSQELDLVKADLISVVEAHAKSMRDDSEGSDGEGEIQVFSADDTIALGSPSSRAQALQKDVEIKDVEIS